MSPDKSAETPDEFFASEDPRRALARDIMRFSRRWRVALDQALKQSGQTYARWRTLYFLDSANDGLTQRELATLMGIEEPGLVRLLDALEDAGLVVRKPSEQDRRSKQVHLLEPGRKALGLGGRAATQLLDSMFADVSDEDIACCVRVIDAALGKLEDRPAPH